MGVDRRRLVRLFRKMPKDALMRRILETASCVEVHRAAGWPENDVQSDVPALLAAMKRKTLEKVALGKFKRKGEA